MQIIIVSPSLDPKKNVSGVASVAKFIIENNTCHDYIHFELGRKDNEKGGFYRLWPIMKGFYTWVGLLRKYPDAVVHYNLPLDKLSVIRDSLFMRAVLWKGNKMVVHIHGGVFLTSDSIPFPFRQMMKWIFSWNLPFISLSEYEAKIQKERFHAKNIVVLPNCIDLKDAKTYNRIFREYPYPLTLGYLGRITNDKGMEYLLKACVLLKERNIPFHLKIAGAEEIERQFIPKFHKKLGNQFEYCGLISGEKKSDFLRSLDLFVLPSFFEGLPISLLECMSYGSVPIVTATGSIPTVVIDQQNGIFVKVKDSESIADAVSNLHIHRDLLERMSIASRKFIFEHFNPRKYVRCLNNIYSNC